MNNPKEPTVERVGKLITVTHEDHLLYAVESSHVYEKDKVYYIMFEDGTDPDPKRSFLGVFNKKDAEEKLVVKIPIEEVKGDSKVPVKTSPSSEGKPKKVIRWEKHYNDGTIEFTDEESSQNFVDNLSSMNGILATRSYISIKKVEWKRADYHSIHEKLLEQTNSLLNINNWNEIEEVGLPQTNSQNQYIPVIVYGELKDPIGEFYESVIFHNGKFIGEFKGKPTHWKYLYPPKN